MRKKMKMEPLKCNVCDVDMERAITAIGNSESPHDWVCPVCHRRTRDWEADFEERAERLIVELTDLLNNLALNDNEVAQTLLDNFLQQHRTLQASVVRVLLLMLKKYGQLNPMYFDLRNEAAGKACRQALPPSFEIMIPLI